jgi:hypothetical protein
MTRDETREKPQEDKTMTIRQDNDKTTTIQDGTTQEDKARQGDNDEYRQ